MNNNDKILLAGAGALGLFVWLYPRRAKATSPAAGKKPTRPTPTAKPKPRPKQKRTANARRFGTYWERLGIGRNDLDIETLARVIISEAGSHTRAEWGAAAWTARNKSVERRTRLLNFICAPCGPLMGRMTNGKRRPFSTRQKATPAARAFAATVLDAKQAKDPTHGATAAFEPILQDRWFKSGRYKRNSKMLRKHWASGGAHKVGTIGRWELWAQKRRR